MAERKGAGMKRVLVTGANGWIGRYCIPILEEKGYSIATTHGMNLIGTDPVMSTALMSDLGRLGCTHLLHLAWMTKPNLYWESPLNIDWFVSSLRLFQAFRDGGGHRIVVAGTCADMTSLYGRAKDSLRRVLEAYSVTGISGAYGKIYYLYGPHEKMERFIPSMVTSFLRGKEYSINHSAQMVDFFHVYDVADALVSILDSRLTGTVDIGDGRPITLRRIGIIVAEAMKCEHLLKCKELPNPQYIAADINRLRAELEWSPKYDIYNGLADTIDWWKKNMPFPSEDNYE